MTTPAHTPPWTFSERARLLTSSAIREILKVTERPEVISFAGGLPAPAGFPIQAIRDAMSRVLDEQGAVALQYGPTEGYAPLRAWVAADLARQGARVSPEEILIVSGSQQALDLLGKVFIDPGSPVLVEDPSYLGALQSFGLYQPRFVPVPTDAHGLLPDSLDAARCAGARFLYALPNFQNPTGRTLPRARRIALLQAAARLGFPVVEDDPYGELRYRGEPEPGLLALSTGLNASGMPGDPAVPQATVIRLGSFSKVLAPSLRLGYIAAPRQIIDKLVQAKQATDLHTPMLIQMAVHDVVRNGFLQEHLPAVRALYERQATCMISALREARPEGVSWTEPEGGMFLWLTLPQGLDSQKLLTRALEERVAFVPGAPFFSGVVQHNTLRLSFVTVGADRIRSGIDILARCIRAMT